MINIEILNLGDNLKELYEHLKILNSSEGIGGKIINQGLNIASGVVKEEWQRLLTKGHSEVGLKNPQNRASKSIKIKKMSNNVYQIYSDFRDSKWMEEQEEDFDMKKTHPYGKKSRVSKKGVPYLIVPFMHLKSGVGSMPKEVYKAFSKKLSEVSRKGMQANSYVAMSNSHTEKNYSGENIGRSSYSWGTRLKGLSNELKNYENMVNMEQATIRADGSSKNYSTAFTFRVISSKSPSGSWIRKARPLVIPKVIDNTTEEIAKIMENYLKLAFID